MTWIVGKFSKKNDLTHIKDFSSNVKTIHKQENLYIAGYGESLITSLNDPNNLFIVCGSGIFYDKSFSIMKKYHWEKQFKTSNDFSKLNGHFLIIQIDRNEIHFSNDPLGLRELFFYDNGKEVFFSTRLDWLIKFIDSTKINLSYLCSYWNLENPIIYESIIQDIRFLGPGGKATISSEGLKISNKLWLPEESDTNINDVIKILNSLISSLIESGETINLGLSGGIDSRTLLSILLHFDQESWATYTFGENSDFDVKISLNLCKLLKFKCSHYNLQLFEHDDVLGTWQEFIKETNGLMPANTYHFLNYYKLLPKKQFFIDGGKGEYIRRSLSNRLALQGKSALIDKNIEKIKHFLFKPKPDIFIRELTETWNTDLIAQVDSLMQNMPEVSEFGIDNWVDLYNIRYRTGNCSFPSQTRLDAITRNFMPFIQPIVLNRIFNLSPKYRQKERINHYILKNSIILKYYPLARYGTIIPFQHNKYTSFMWGKIMSFFVREPSTEKHLFLHKNREYILSRLSDIGFVNSQIYNKKKIRKMASDYFKGTRNNANYLIWWMTFDVWHQLIYEKY